MRVEYKKDLRHNYLVVTDCEEFLGQPYCIRMLEQQEIEGLLPFERRSMDNKISYSYDITGKQSVLNLYDKSTLTFHKIKTLLSQMIDILEHTYEYLLPEDDFVLTPEFIFLDIITDKPFLCYLPGVTKNIKEQMVGFLEYLMNKVDYNDKDAVMLVYQLYAVSREEGFTIGHLQETLGRPLQTAAKTQVRPARQEEDLKQKGQQQENQSRDQKPIDLKQREQNPEYIDIPAMMERIDSEEEVQAYPASAYVYSAISVCGGILVLLLGFLSKLLYNAYGSRLEYGRVLGFILIIFCTEGYLMNKIWDKKNKLAKIVTKTEYIDPRLAYASEGISSTGSAFGGEDRSSPAKEAVEKPKAEEYNPTLLLNDVIVTSAKTQEVLLKSLDEDKYASIILNEFPFFIGKLKKNVDYCLEREGISRFHAKLTREQDKYFITDLNSTNGTFVNGVELQTYTKQEIVFGDKIALANLNFRFDNS